MSEPLAALLASDPAAESASVACIRCGGHEDLMDVAFAPGMTYCKPCRVWRAARQEAPIAAQDELPDFHPETGHLHTCADRLTCDCAARLYCLAEDVLDV